MKVRVLRGDGSKDGLEYGNAWELHQEGATTNWIVGQTDLIPIGSLRFMQQDGNGSAARNAKNLAIKWFVHKPDDDPDWGKAKPTSEGRTISLLAGDGAFELVFTRPGVELRVLLDNPGDYAICGPGWEHSWRPLKTSTVVTVRWTPLDA